MRITRENTIGLVIDMQERLVPAMEGQEELLHNSQILISGLQELNIPIIATQQYSKGLGETVEPIRSIIKDFSPIEKKDFSCCDEDNFAAELEKLHATNIIICGIESHVCVLQTALDLKEVGLNPVIVMDCVSSRSYDSIDLAAERFRFEGIMMTSYESVLFELTRSASAPEFKAISKLVK